METERTAQWPILMGEVDIARKGTEGSTGRGSSSASPADLDGRICSLDFPVSETRPDLPGFREENAAPFPEDSMNTLNSNPSSTPDRNL